MTLLATSRLSLVPFTDDHVDGLNVLNSDPEVMRYISGRPETRDETLAVVDRVKKRWIEFGYSWWSFIELGSGEIVGAGALQNLRRGATPAPDPACQLNVSGPCWMGFRFRSFSSIAFVHARSSRLLRLKSILMQLVFELW